MREQGGSGRRALVWCLIGVSALYLVLAVAVNLRTRAWENNDEESHIRYTTYLRQHHALPPLDLDYGDEVHQAPLYYAGLAVWEKALRIPPFRPDFQLAAVPPPSQPQDVAYKVQHDYSAAEQQQARWLHLLRLFSTLLGLVTVIACFATALQVTGMLSVATAVGATVAVWPKFLVVTAAITNDALADAACAVAVATLVAWVRSGRWPWALASGVALGAAALSKATTLPVVFILLAIVAVLAWRRRDWRAVIATAAPVVALAGWWYVRNRVVYGDFLAATASNRYLDPFLPGLIRPHPTLAAVPDYARTLLTNSLWYDGGWNQLTLPRWWAVALTLAALACATAAVVVGRRRILRMDATAVVLLGAVAGAAVSWVALVRDTTQGEGRYLFVAVAGLATLLVTGAARLFPDRLRLGALFLWPLALLAAGGYVAARWLIPFGGL